MNKTLNLKAIDFFCGAGGMTHGLIQSGISVIAGIDCDPTCKKTYETNNNSKYIQTDISTFHENELSSFINKNDDSLIFVGCAPCQFYSKVNTDKNKSIKSKSLLEEFQRFVAFFNPGYIVVENVPGFMKKKDENIHSNFITFLKEHLYNFDEKIVCLTKYGIPQHRTRYLLIASRIGNIKLPQEKSNSLTVRDFLGEHNGFQKISDGHKDNSNFLHTAAILSKQNKERIKITKKDGGTRLCWSDSELQIPAYKGKDHFFKDVYGRMHWDKPAPTITTRFNSLSNGRFGHPEEDRAISLREGATLQTFPKDYQFLSSSNAIISKHIGNAVPPELAKKLGQTIVDHFCKFHNN